MTAMPLPRPLPPKAAAASGPLPLALAFNRGAQARLAGHPPTNNPYRGDQHRNEHTWWEKGYYHLARYWGVGVRGRWRYRPLPPVREVEKGAVSP